mgnify:CR=1 FL=1
MKKIYSVFSKIIFLNVQSIMFHSFDMIRMAPEMI